MSTGGERKYAAVAFPLTLMEGVRAGDPDAEDRALELIIRRYQRVKEDQCTTQANMSDDQLS
jgi:hypothetical protein